MTGSLRRLLVPALLTIVMGALLLVGGGAGSAQAGSPPHEAPLNLDGPITDRVGALAGQDDDVKSAIDALFDARGIQLFVVYVDSFEGQSGQSWAEATAEISGLSDQDVLLAVAVEDRSYGFSFPPTSSGLSGDESNRLEREVVLPQLRDGNWAEAAIAAAQALDDDLAPGPPWGLITLGGVGVAGAAGGTGLVIARRRRRAREEGREVEVGQALLASDEAVKSAADEVAFAEAQFGAEATAAFREAASAARTTLDRAFADSKQLEGDELTGDQHDALTDRLLAVCSTVQESIAGHVAEFSALRTLIDEGPAALAALAPDLAALTDRLVTARGTLADLAGRHRADDLERYRGLPDEAERHLTSARTAVDESTAAFGAGDKPLGARRARAAQQARDAATSLLAEVDGAESALAQLVAQRAKAAERLTAVTAEVDQAARYIDEHGSKVKESARGKLSDAARRLDDARADVDRAPDRALSVLAEASSDAAEAERLARGDVADANRPRTSSVGRSSGGFSGGRSSGGRSSGGGGRSSGGRSSGGGGRRSSGGRF